jgi:hypothetical protein
MPTSYYFISRWQIRAPLADVWNVIYDTESWCSWWKGVLEVKKTVDGATNGIGDVYEYLWRGRMPYNLHFFMEVTDKINYKMIKARSSGNLNGTGTFHFEEKDGISYVAHYWEVRTSNVWVSVFSFILKPVFKRNHDLVMKWGATGLARHLNAELVSY